MAGEDTSEGYVSGGIYDILDAMDAADPTIQKLDLPKSPDDMLSPEAKERLDRELQEMHRNRTMVAMHMGCCCCRHEVE